MVFQEEMLKQIQETELFNHVIRWLASEISLCKVVASLGYRETLPEIAANVCCEGAELLNGNPNSLDGMCCTEMSVTHLKAGEGKPMTVVSGIVATDGTEEGIDMLVPLSRKETCNLCDFDQSNCKGMHPSTGDVLTILLLALPKNTWSGIKDEKLYMEFTSLVSIDSLPSLLQEEVIIVSFILLTMNKVL